ncbi:hypothetical protein [Microbacterium sp. NPDC057944]|uniref:hypothetical protein n=1 Tax=Microbacterium sp. NPDC057944 TaxID=3346286 RepID=UPI0036DA1852
MPWFKVDDHFWSHPKTAGLSDGAVALWLRAGSWSAGHLTDGRVPVSMLRMFRARRRSAEELVAAGLWSIVGETPVERSSHAGDAFVFTSWDEYQPSKAQVESKREATRNRVNAWRERQGNGVSNESPGEDRNAPPDPTRPDPTSISNEIDGRPRKRGTRIPDPFIVTAEMRAWAAERTSLVDVNASTERFVNHWRAKAGRDATKVDWPATWRNWLIRDQEDRQNRRLTPTERAQQTAAAGRNVAGQQITSLNPKEVAS